MQSGTKNLHYGWIVTFTSLMVSIGAIGLARFGYTMLLPAMKEGLRLSEIQLGDLAMGNMIGYLILSIVGGLLASRFSPRRIISLSMIAVGGSMILTGIASNFTTAFLFRFITGAGSGSANVPVMGLISRWFSTRRRGLASGIVVSGSGFGLLFTGLVIPRVLDRFGDASVRYSWFLLGIITLLIAALSYVLLRDKPQDKGLLPIGGSSHAPTPPASSSLQWRGVYKKPAVWYLASIYFLFGFSYIIYTTFFAHYLIQEQAMAAKTAGSLWSFIGTVSLVSGFVWGSLSDRTGRRFALVCVFFLQGVSFTLFGLWKATGGYYLSAFFFALTAWSIPAIVTATSGDLVGARLAPAALGFVTLFFGLGQAAGPFTAGRITDLSGSYSHAFLTAAAAAFLGSVLSLLLLPKKKTEHSG